VTVVRGTKTATEAARQAATRAARRVPKPDGTLWVTGTHHIIFSLGFALQRLGFSDHQLSVAWHKPDPPPNALHTAFTH
jgi:site-specific DNA-methyltransferase (adenine-specific)